MLIRLSLMIVIMIMAACSSVAINLDDSVVKMPDKVLYAQGYSKLQRLTYLTDIQNKFAVEQAATIKAYRKLAEQLYSVRLTGGLTVADQVIKNDDFRVYVDLFLREAKVVKSKSVADLKMIKLELTLSPRFFYCISATKDQVEECLREDGKVQFTRIGYQHTSVSTVNLSCFDCSSQFSIAGFSTEKSALDKGLLNLGLYDSEWGGSMVASTVIRYLYLGMGFK